MTMSLKKLSSTFTNLTVNRGVEAKEIEIGNTQLDVDTSSSSRTLTESSALAAGDAPRPTSPLLLSDQSASFIQVVVQKQHRTGQTRARLPAASSPAAAAARPAAAIFTPTFPKTMHENSSVPAAVLLACPAYAALNQQSWDKVLSCVNENTRASEASHRASGDACTTTKKQEVKKNKRTTKKFLWKKTNGAKKKDWDLFKDPPERIEVYRLAGGGYVSARAAAPARLERAARRLARPAAAALRELLAAPRLLFAAIVAVVIQLERCVLESVCGALCGAAAAAADAALLPALAAAAGAARAVLLVAAPAAAAAGRALAAALGAALEPLARLLAALRLVHVERACHCAAHARCAPARRHQCTQV